MKKKLMLITHDLGIGGLQQVVVNLCKAIDKEKFEISVLCLRALGVYSKEIEKLGIKIYFLGNKNTDYFMFLKVAKLLRREKIDIIHTHNTQPLIDGTLGALLSNVKTIVHTDHAREFPDKIRYMIAEHAMSYFAYRVVGVSQHTCENLINYEKIYKKKIRIIENGIEADKFKYEIDKNQKKKELGLSANSFILGIGARLVKQKGITFLLEAVSQLRKEDVRVELVIAGEGPEKEILKKQCESLGIKKHVHFVGPRGDMHEILKIFDLYVLPSIWEGLPMALLEAMASGCPIIATNVGGVPTAIIRNWFIGRTLRIWGYGQRNKKINR